LDCGRERERESEGESEGSGLVCVKAVLGGWESYALSGLLVRFVAGNKLIWFIIAVNIQKNGRVGEWRRNISN
jgi:hypothetical protein